MRGLGLRAGTRYPVPDSVPREGSRFIWRGRDLAWKTVDDGSNMLPKVIAPMGQASWQAV